MTQISVIYEDNHLLVVVKPPNLLSQADRTGDPDLLSLMKEYVREKYRKPGNVYLGLVHRLDRPVGGVMGLARTSTAAGRLSAQIREGRLERGYLAVVHGYLEKLEGTLRGYLLKDRQKNLVKLVEPGRKGAQEALLHYRVVHMKGGRTLVRVKLETGRSHQIRVQLAALGHPLVGDQRYGPPSPGQQIALWAEELSFTHPTTGARLEFRERPPQAKPWSDFQEALS
ncbi:MAG: RluA family pseudouridine synthase [Limnochordia bacterium]